MAGRKKIGEIDGDLILVGGLVLGGFLLLKPIVDKLSGNSEDDKTVTDVTTLPAEQNPFSINYQYSLYGMAPSAYGQAFYQNLQQTVFNTPGINQTSGIYNIATQAEILENAFSAFWETDSDVQAVFDNLGSKADVSNIAAYLYFVHGEDLYNLLLNGKGFIPFLNRGLSTSSMAKIINQVNSLPAQ